ncbi:OmpA family protein [Muricauda sp. ANG21]|uniref:OmpA family protein n=1 Tax=Allomuricauda sp. ANG21 TaxID=3042468 RepID=UPI0034541924
MKKVALLIAFCTCTAAVSQSKLERADQFFNDFEFDRAIELYQDLVSQKRKSSTHIIQRLADAHFNQSEYHKAKDWYVKLYTIEGKGMGENNIIKLVQCLKASMEPEQADKLLREFYSDRTSRLDMIMAQKQHLDSSLQKEPMYEIQTLAFNSKKSDFAPSMYNGKLVFASARDTVKSNGKLYPWNNQPYLDLYLTHPNESNFVPEKFLENLESAYHDSNLAFDSRSQRVYFTRNYLKKNKLSANSDGLSNMHILQGTIYNNELVNVTSMAFNSKEYSCGHPALSADGKYLYFTSNMPGGQGESDIYVVELGVDGDAITPPMNLGPTINTRGREMFPFVDGSDLYFSSDGHYGLGGLDVFVSQIKSKSQYSLPINLGNPVNGNMDDFSLVLNHDKGNGYFASNRFGGKGDDDIYYLEKAKPINCLEYSGYVLNEKTGEPITLASFELYDLSSGLLEAGKTDETGYFKFILPCNKESKMVFFKPRFSKKEVFITTNENPEEASVNNMIYLTPFESLVVKEGDVEKIKVNPIYFEYDKSDITPRAEIELEKVLFVMREFPEVKIKIESHTDSRGTDQYNFRLSDDRAKSTMRYLIAKGVDTDRIVSANGYGEYRLKNKCANGVQCTEQEHLVNRRSDFIIVKQKSDLVNGEINQ